MDYVEGNRNNFVHQLACNLNRKGISYAEALGFILSDYNYNEIEVMNAVKSSPFLKDLKKSLLFNKSSLLVITV